MRLAALILLALALSASTAVGSRQGPGGTLVVTDGRGVVQVTGKDALIGRVVKGSLKIVDLTPADQWSPYVNGVPRGKVVWLKGRNINFRISAGRYRIVATGEGIWISARGTGTVVLDGDPDKVGNTGTYYVGDSTSEPLPVEATTTSFGLGEGSTPSPQSGKIQP